MGVVKDELVVPLKDAPGLYIRLGALLDLQGMSLAEFSRRIGVKDDNVRTLRDGGSKAIRFRNLRRICKVLGCQPGDLLHYVPAEDPEEHGAPE